MARDPRIHPVPGDFLTKETVSGQKVSRRVTRVDDGVHGGENRRRWITYVQNRKEKICWVTTWWEWAQDAVVITEGEAP